MKTQRTRPARIVFIAYFNFVDQAKANALGSIAKSISIERGIFVMTQFGGQSIISIPYRLPGFCAGTVCAARHILAVIVIMRRIFESFTRPGKIGIYLTAAFFGGDIRKLDAVVEFIEEQISSVRSARRVDERHI